MESKKKFFLFCIILSMFVTRTLAYDIAVENADGITIYYNYINDGKELEVTYNKEFTPYSGIIVIPEDVVYMNNTRRVTSIGESAFSHCYDLTSVTIGNEVKYIGHNAFSGCSGLTTVNIGDNVELIGYGAFEDCSSLTSVTIPNSVTTIQGHAFFKCI